MIIFGISEGFHDSSLCVLKDENILYAAHSERYSKIKNDPSLNNEIIKDALKHGYPDLIAYYENPFLKKTRLFLKGGIKDRPLHYFLKDRKSTRLNSSHSQQSRMPSSA